jgi:hypothetical protein
MDIRVRTRDAHREGRPKGCQEDQRPSFCGKSSLRVTVTCKLSSILVSSRELLTGIRTLTVHKAVGAGIWTSTSVQW